MDGEIDENFWAQAAADRVDGSDPDGESARHLSFHLELNTHRHGQYADAVRVAVLQRRG